MLVCRCSLFGPPPLIEGEDVAAYCQLSAQISAGVKPSDILEDIWVRDIVDITTDIFRLRRLKSKLLKAAVSDARDRAVKPILDRELDQLLRELWKKQQEEKQQREPELSREDWKKRAEQDPVVIKKLNEVRTAAESGLDIDSLIARAFVNELEHIERIDHLTTIAEGRRNSILREIDRRRAFFAEMLRETLRKIEDIKPGEPKAIVNATKSAA